LDACRPCNLVWFDASEFEAIPEKPLPKPDELTLRGAEVLAVHKAELLAERARAEDVMPDEQWKWVAGFLGMPVELDSPGLTRLPWVTWSLSAAIAFVSILAFSDIHEIAEEFGIIPDSALRYGGFTFVSSFFLHAGMWHLVSNLYFFLVFGGKVEDYLGRARFGWLILASTVGGDVLDFLFDPHSTVPSIGASGGISGVLAFYALEFPRARLAFAWRFQWFALPAWVAFSAWIFLQMITAAEQVHGMSKISGLAHLGGAAVGFAWWLKWGDSMRKSDKGLNRAW